MRFVSNQATLWTGVGDQWVRIGAVTKLAPQRVMRRRGLQTAELHMELDTRKQDLLEDRYLSGIPRLYCVVFPDHTTYRFMAHVVVQAGAESMTTYSLRAHGPVAFR